MSNILRAPITFSRMTREMKMERILSFYRYIICIVLLSCFYISTSMRIRNVTIAEKKLQTFEETDA